MAGRSYVGNSSNPKYRNLPSGYTQVEYIEGTGTQYIETDLVPNQNWGFECTGTMNNTFGSSNYGILFGTRRGTDGGKNRFKLSSYSESGQSARFEKETASYTIIAQRGVKFTVSATKNTLTRANETTASVTTTAFTGSTLYIFASNDNGTVAAIASGRIYSLKFTNDGDIVADYCPCVRISDGEPGLYDLVTDAFLTNNGTGTFIVGHTIYPEVAIRVKKIYFGEPNSYYRNLPSTYTQVKYIQNNGISYIDTGVTVNENLRAEVDFQFIEKKYGFEACVLGVWNDYSRMRLSINTTDEFKQTDGTISQDIDIFARTQAVVTPAEGYTSPYNNLWIFAQNNYEESVRTAYWSIMRLYSLKIYDGDVLIRDYIPVIRKLDGMIGLYDACNDIFYEPIDGIPNEYKRVEYVESTGTQYIDTGYTVVDNTGSFIKFMTLDDVASSNYGAIFGADEGSPSYNRAYYMETWTNDDKLGKFKRASTSYDAKIVKDQILSIGHSGSVNTFVYNDGTYVSVNTDSYTPTATQYLFCINRTTSLYYGKTRIYNFVYLEGARPVHSYIPVIRVSDNKPGLYDIVTSEFLSSNTKDDLLAGNIISNDFESGSTFISGISHIIRKGYIGDNNNIARLIYEYVWYLCDGLSETDVIAAYDFANAENETKALININDGTEYPLIKSSGITWEPSIGFIFPATKSLRLYNDTLNGLYTSVKTIIFKFSGASTASGNLTIGGSYLHTTRSLLIRGAAKSANTYYHNAPSINRTGSATSYKSANAKYAEGVLGGNFESTAADTVMYIDGILQSLTNSGGNSSSSYTSVWGSENRGIIAQPKSLTIGAFNVQAIVLYNKSLTALEHSKIASQI